ncbi:MAG: DUF126 domain-containing protein [Pseudomonadota bacterium]
MTARTLFAGSARGELMTLAAPVSFWGGVDPRTSAIVNARHPQKGELLRGRVVAIPQLVGSSSSAAVLLELICAGAAPAAILLREVDAILVMGCLAAQTLGDPAPPVVQMAQLPAFPDGTVMEVDAQIALEPVIRAAQTPSAAPPAPSPPLL